MKLIIGLGNIGKEYAKTRHNIGFMCLKKFAGMHELAIKNTRLYSYYWFDDCMLIMPRTYMNRSGEAYSSAVSKHGGFDEIIVIMDDIELPVGDIRIRTSGGDGGHNGLKSVIEKKGNSDFSRIRIGIGRSETDSPRNHVLDCFTKTEASIIDVSLNAVCDWLGKYIKNDMALLLDEYSKWKAKPIPSS